MKLKNPSLQKEKKRLDALIELFENRSCDFDEMLFFELRKNKNPNVAFRKALDQYIKNYDEY